MVTSLVLGMTGLSVLYLLRYPTRRKVSAPPPPPRAEYHFGEPHLPTWKRKTTAPVQAGSRIR